MHPLPLGSTRLSFGQSVVKGVFSPYSRGDLGMEAETRKKWRSKASLKFHNLHQKTFCWLYELQPSPWSMCFSVLAGEWGPTSNHPSLPRDAWLYNCPLRSFPGILPYTELGMFSAWLTHFLSDTCYLWYFSLPFPVPGPLHAIFVPVLLSDTPGCFLMLRCHVACLGTASPAVP